MTDDALYFESRAELAGALWTVAAIADHFGVSHEAVQGWVRRDDFPPPFTKVGRSLVWMRSDIEDVWDASKRSRGRVWTKSRIVAAIQEFNRRYGRPPSATDWNVGALKKMKDFERLARFYEDGCYPHMNTVHGVSGEFRYWADAIEAAGFRRPEPGRYETPTRRYRVPQDIDAALNGAVTARSTS